MYIYFGSEKRAFCEYYIVLEYKALNIYKAVDELVEKLDRGLRRRSRLRRVKRKQISLQDLPYAA